MTDQKPMSDDPVQALKDRWLSLAAHYRDICLHSTEDGDTYLFNMREARHYEDRAQELADTLAALGGSGWQPIGTAKQVSNPEIIGMNRHGEVRRMHWASDLSGSEQPAFQGWFYPTYDSTGRVVRYVDYYPSWWLCLPPTPKDLA